MSTHHKYPGSLVELEKIVSQGESETLEFKKSLTQLKPAMETLCGFLNAKGGMIVIGANQEGKLIGSEVTDNTRQEIAREIHKLEPLPEVKIDYLELGIAKNHYIIVISTNAGNAKPYVYDGRPYYRNQSSTMRMPQNRYLHMAKEANTSPYDTWEMKLVPDIGISDLDQEEIKRTVQIAVEHRLLPAEALQDSIESILNQLELRRNNQLTNATMVLFAAHRSAGFSQCCIKMARFRGNDELKGFIDNQTVTGNAFQLMREASIFIQRHLSVESLFDESQFERIDKPALPVLAIREALCNAICHRDYSTFTASIHLAIYDNRLEVWNNGLLTTYLTFDDLKKRHTSHPRNKHIAQVFYLRRYIESWGTGTTRMIALCKENNLPEPTFTEYSGGFSVTFFFKEESSQVKASTNLIPIEQLSTRRQEIIRLLEKSDPISIHTLIAQLNNPPSERMVRKDLVALRNAGYIRLIGYGRSALWAISHTQIIRNNQEERGTTRNNKEP